MTSGFLSRSIDGGFLLSSDVSHLHFHGFAAAGSSNVITSEYGGCRLFSFTSNAQGAPLFFIRQDGRLASIVRLSGSSGAWSFSVLREGTDSTPPQVFVFTQPQYMTAVGNVGMILRNASNEIVFDSRLKPFVASSATFVTPSSIAPNGGIPPNDRKFIDQGEGQGAWPSNDWDFQASNTKIAHSIPAVAVPIVASYSTGQACYERKMTQYWYDDEYDGKEHHWRAHLWWCFYREAVAVSGSTLYSGWIPFRAGYVYQLTKDDGWWGGTEIDAIHGSYPFYQKTTNLRSNVVIVADGSAYL